MATEADASDCGKCYDGSCEFCIELREHDRLWSLAVQEARKHSCKGTGSVPFRFKGKDSTFPCYGCGECPPRRDW